jgi:hypothetical protein
LRTAFCISEDREIDEIGVRIALCSLRRHCPDAPVFVFRAAPTEDFRAWLHGFPQVTLLPFSPPGASSWNCKPQALLTLFDRGCEEVVWIDSDLLLARDCRYLFRELDPEVFVVAQEAASATNQGSQLRTEGWGFAVGRCFSRTLNSCVIRVTPRHRQLLERWRSLLEDPRYSQYQTCPLSERPQHCWSDQDVLNALLGSEEFSSVPVRELRTGRDIVHCSSATSYSFAERLGGLFRPVPPFVHCQAGKPWVLFHPKSLANTSPQERYQRIVVETGAYFFLARRYQREIGRDDPWIGYSSLLGLAAACAGLGRVQLTGLPLSFVGAAAKGLARLKG